MTTEFVHLSVHTQYSISDSAVRIPELMRTVSAELMPAVALTDQGNLFAMVKFYRQSMKAGIKPLIGVDLRVDNADDSEACTRLILLCKNLIGYRNLTRLVTRSFLEGQESGPPSVARDWLTRETCGGLVALSGGIDGEIGRTLLTGDTTGAARLLAHWQDIFDGDFYLELTRIGRPGEERYIQGAVQLAASEGAAVVATNDVRFINAEDFNAHEARVCIHQSRTLNDAQRPRHYTPQQYLKSPQEMAALFQDIPEAISNTLGLAAKLSLDIQLGESFLPRFPVPEGQTEAGYLIAVSRDALTHYLANEVRGEVDEAAYRGRLEAELSVICEMGFPGYFLIVADFIRWAKTEDIPVGPGRGSGAGSLVAWVLGITDIDPLEYDLLFERFLNPERVSMPDFDIDFCMEGRDQVIDYVAERYGRERVSQIITYGTMAAKAVVRDAGRVLGQPYGFVDRIAKLIPFEIGMTLEKALDTEAELAELVENDAEVGAVIDLARSLEGLVRNAGKHAGGVVIAPTELTDFAPLYCEPGRTNVVTQFDKDDVEAAGLVKFDFLGLRTLTVIDWAVKSINRARARTDETPLRIRDIPLDDAATFKLLQAYQTTAVFQLESRGMKDLIKRLCPDKFEDLIALVALFRPGPLQSGMVDDFIERKHQPESVPVDYLHPDLEPVLRPTYGVILYQEQVMQIAQVLAGYTLGGADLLRRAMGKKKAEEMAKQREIFTDGAKARGVVPAQATHIFDLMEKFAGYGFNKSHSAAYALLSYQTAWLKAHYPAPFMAAVMSADIDNTDKLVTLKADCRQIGVEVLPPDINKSAYHFGAAGERAILYGLGALKGVGRNVVQAIVREREENGEFLSLTELCQRMGDDGVNRRAYEAMIKAGSLDCVNPNRRALLAELPAALKSADQAASAVAAGQNDMFGLDAPEPVVAVSQPTIGCWTDFERLQAEKESLGLYLSGHPFDMVRDDAAYFTTGTLGHLASTPEPSSPGGEKNYARRGIPATVAGLVMDIRKRGNRVTFLLDDDTAQMEVSLFSEAWLNFKHLLVKDTIVVTTGTLRYDDFIGGWRLAAKQVEAIDRVIEDRAQRLVLSIKPNGQGEQLLYQLHDLLMPHRAGQCGVLVNYTGDCARARLRLGDDWRVRPSRELRDQLETLLGSASVRLFYAQSH